jgi:hypothetical protein
MIETELKPFVTEFEFPKIMINKISGTIVLFETEERGVTLYGDPCSECLGDYSNRWNMEHFIDYHGTITLKNLKY